MLAQKKTTTKPPWDADLWRVKEVKGSQITVTRGNKERRHAKNLVKVVKLHTRVHFIKEKTRRRMEEPECLSLDQIKTADKRGHDERSPALHSWNDWGDRLGSRMPDRSPFPLHGWSHVKGAGASFLRSFSPCYLYKLVCKGRLKRFNHFGGIFHGRGGGIWPLNQNLCTRKKGLLKWPYWSKYENNS